MRQRLPRSVRAAGLLLALGVALAVAAFGGPAAAVPEAAAPAGGDAAHGQVLYRASCAGCHGQHGEGTQNAPSLVGVGAAAADFYLQTGRMPLAEEKAQAASGPRQFSQPDIADLDAFVGSLGDGPAVPDVSPGDLALGRELYLQNCAACHGSSGAGFTQVGGAYAPSLFDTDPTQVAEAVRVGPLLMPQFPDEVLDAHEVDSIVTYVRQLQDRDQQNRGGWGIAQLGPTTETVIGFAGLGLLLVVIRLIGKRAGG
jgi:ubiquinol-cytochrome c reductase cytochrome c subunit